MRRERSSRRVPGIAVRVALAGITLLTVAGGLQAQSQGAGGRPLIAEEDPVATDLAGTAVTRPGWPGHGAAEPIHVMLELEGPPAARVWTTRKARGRHGQAVAAARAQRLANDRAQHAVLAAMGRRRGLNAKVVFRAQRALNGIAVVTTADQIPELAALPSVTAVRPIALHEPSLSSSVPFIGTPTGWTRLDPGGNGLTGQGVRIGIIDSGIDYLHTQFGGPGDPASYQANDPTDPDDTPGYFGSGAVKVVGGFDFAGETYNAGSAANNVPVPDGDPWDCSTDAAATAGGHGTHVASITAGFGVNGDGTTYAGPWNDAGQPDFLDLRIGPGTAPEAHLYALRVFGCRGSTALAIQAIDWALDPDGDGDLSDHLDVINLSLGSAYGSPDDAMLGAADTAAAMGVVVVASAGNSGDTYYITGSPAAAPRAISTASGVDAGVGFPRLRVLDPEAIARTYDAAGDTFGPPLRSPGVTADLHYDASIASKRHGCTGATYPNNPWLSDPGSAPLDVFQGRIALIDRGTCTFTHKIRNAEDAGAAAVIVVNSLATPPFTMGGTCGGAAEPACPTIPAIMISLADGNTIKSQVVTPGVRATVSSDLFRSVGDTLSAFSSRGPSRLGSALKPDLTAPGDTIRAARNQTGDQAIAFSGTSMASPHVAGVMALLKQQHPTWSVAELKALALNTADHDLFTAPGSGVRYGQGRVGVGRVDVAAATANSVIAFDHAAPERVSLSFGALEVDGTVQAARTVQVVDRGPAGAGGHGPVTYDLAFETVVDTPGVSFSLPTSSITVEPGTPATFDVLLDADASAMRHTREATVAATQASGGSSQSRHFLTEETGYVTLTPQEGAGDRPTLRIPAHVAARPISKMGTVETVLTMTDATGSTQVELDGSELYTGDVIPSDIWSVVSLFELAETSPDDPDPSGTSGAHNNADLQYVGVTSTYRGGVFPGSSRLLLFAIATHGTWDSPNATAFHVMIDVDRNGSYDFVAFNASRRSFFEPVHDDVYLAFLCQLPFFSGCSSRVVNVFSPATLDTVLMNTNVMVLPVSIGALGLDPADPVFDYQVASYSRDSGARVDLSAVHTYNAAAPGLAPALGASGLPASSAPFYEDFGGKIIPIDYDRTAFRAAKSKGLMLVHHHNGAGARVQVLPVETPDICQTDAECDDENPCTNDTCAPPGCVFTPVTCADDGDPCNGPESCDPATGACVSGPAAGDGTDCNDGNACTRTDTCQAGVCTGGNPVTCVAQSQCHSAGTCDPDTGACSNPPKPSGTACDDDSACTLTDLCDGAGSCRGQRETCCADGLDNDGDGSTDCADADCLQPLRTAGFWAQNPAAWPVTSLVLGSQTYTRDQLIALLTTRLTGGARADASLILAQQLIAAKLNLASGTDPTPIAATVAQADGLLRDFAGKLPYKVKPNSAIGQAMVAAATTLENYNRGLLTTSCPGP